MSRQKSQVELGIRREMVRGNFGRVRGEKEREMDKGEFVMTYYRLMQTFGIGRQRRGDEGRSSRRR